jgi:hypothetical protein
MHLNLDINLGVDIEEVYVPFAYKLCYYCPLDCASTTPRIFQLVI